MSVMCSLFVVFGAFVSFVSLKDADTTQFEAAFQGRCGHDSPCEQLCYELHDGMFECDCKEGFLLHTNGYSCLTINGSNELTARSPSVVDDRLDIIYQKDALFSASLDVPKDTKENRSVSNVTDSVTFITRNKFSQDQNLSLVSTSTEAVRTNDSTLCARSCGTGTCLVETAEQGSDDDYSQRCQCTLGKTGSNCQADLEIRVPKFSGQSWLAFPVLRAAYKHIQLEIEFRPESWDGVLFLTGERDDLAGDFVAIILHEGFVEFRFDCGSGVGVIRSDETVLLNKWNKLILYRHRWDAWIQLNKGKHIQGRSKGLFSRITFREPVFIGGRGNTTVLTDKIPTDRGFKGCVRYLEINGVLYNFAASPTGDAVSGFDVEECVADKCSNVPCKHGGKCITNDDSTQCLCPLGFIGDLCDTRLDLQIPLFNGSSYLKYHGLGYNALSWLDLELILKPTSSDGIVLYNGHKIDGMGDFIAVYMSAGYLTFTFDLGTGSATVRSTYPVTLDEWHTLRISRTGRYALLQVDTQPPAQVMSPGAFTQLSLHLNLFVGGVPNFDLISPKIKTRNSFVGCIQKITINERPLHILAEALGGLNIDNCPHPCLAKPCGFENDLSCQPLFDSYKCVCERNCRKGFEDNEVASTNDIVTFNEESFLHYTDPEVNKRITSSNVSINLRFKTTSVMGLLLWYGSKHRNKDFLSLGITNGYLHLSYNVGNGDVSLLYNVTRIDDGHWHRVNIFREEFTGSVMVDNGEAIVIRSRGSFRQINANSGLYIGGVEDIATTTHYRYTKGIRGCISDFVLNSDYHVRLSWKKEDLTLCE